MNHKKEYIEWLNAQEIPFDDRKSNGGRIPDHVKLGTWMAKNDPVQFEVGLFDFVRDYV